MSKKKKSGSRTPKSTSKDNAQRTPEKQSCQAPVSRPPKWGILVAGLLAFLIVSTAIIVMDKTGVTNQMVRTGVVMVLAVAAGLGARPLTLALHRRLNDN